MKAGRGLRRLAVAATVLLVVLAGLIYAASRPEEHKSEAKLVLHIGKVAPGSVPNYLDGFDQAGTSGTFVEHLTSEQTLQGAGSPAIDVTARAVPDTRVIDVEAVGDRAVVRRGLDAVIRSAQVRQNVLKDPFRLGVLSPPGPAEVAGPADALLVLATFLLAALAGLFVFVVTRAPQDRAAPSTEP